MKTLCGMAVVVLVLLGTGAAWAGAEAQSIEEDGNVLLAQCTAALRWLKEFSPRKAIDQHLLWEYFKCEFAVTAILDRNEWSESAHDQPFCLPWRLPWRRLLTDEQAMRLVVRYLQAHPERLDLPRDLLIIEALRDAFPCPPAPAASRPQR